MKYGIIADMHGNLEALEAALSELDERKPDEIVCLGDMVSYGADPAECIRLVNENCSAVVRGNHDHAVVNEDIRGYFNPDALTAVEWTAGVLEEESRDLLGGLEMKKTIGNFLMVHSSPLFPGEWRYVRTSAEAGQNFSGFDEDLCFFGHTHVPSVFMFNEEDGACRAVKEPLSFLPPRFRYMINPGSVGQPRDGNPEASFAVFDAGRRELEIIRVPYDFKSAARKIRAAGLPEKHAAWLEAET